jgi:hypothetical protein
MRASARVALVLMTVVSASFGLAACGAIEDLRDAVSRWFVFGKSPGPPGGFFADDLPDATPTIPPEKPLQNEASEALKKKDKPASKVKRPQTAEKKPPTSDIKAKPQDAEPQSAPTQPTPSRLRTLWPEAPPAGTFSR